MKMAKQSNPKKRVKQSTKRQAAASRSTGKAAKRAPAPRVNSTLADDLAAIRRRRFAS
jgi:hypothetical protein